MAARAKPAVPTMTRPAAARPTISPQRPKDSRPCRGSLMACCPFLVGQWSHRPAVKRLMLR